MREFSIPFDTYLAAMEVACQHQMHLSFMHMFVNFDDKAIVARNNFSIFSSSILATRGNLPVRQFNPSTSTSKFRKLKPIAFVVPDLPKSQLISITNVGFTEFDELDVVISFCDASGFPITRQASRVNPGLLDGGAYKSIALDKSAYVINRENIFFSSLLIAPYLNNIGTLDNISFSLLSRNNSVWVFVLKEGRENLPVLFFNPDYDVSHDYCQKSSGDSRAELLLSLMTHGSHRVQTIKLDTKLIE